jgi:hypothetical protein
MNEIVAQEQQARHSDPAFEGAERIAAVAVTIYSYASVQARHPSGVCTR